MRRALMLVLVVALGALVFAPAAFAQDDNPSGDDLGGDDRGGERAFDDNPSGDDLGADRGGDRGFDDNPTGDDPGASSTSSATASATPTATPEASPSPRADAGVLPNTGGLPLLALAAGVLLVGGGITATILPRRAS